MPMAEAPRHCPRQRGVALLLMLFVLVIGAAALFLTAWNAGPAKAQADDKTQRAMQQAKDALIAWSATHPTLPGSLPCPEDTSKIGTSDEGTALSTCTGTGAPVGRLPWKTLGLEPAGDGEPLWYVLSPTFLSSPINSDTPGQLQIDTQPEPVVALIIAPGAPLAGQNRGTLTATSPPAVANYLDGTNADGDVNFTMIPVPGTVNDRVLAITRPDLMRAVEQRVVNEVRHALLEYYCYPDSVTATGACNGTSAHPYFPRPAAFSDTGCLGTGAIASGCGSSPTDNEGRLPANPNAPWGSNSILTGSPLTWFQANGWREMIYYAVAPACTDGTTNCNGSTYLSVLRPGMAATTDTRFVVIAAGRYLGGATPSTTRNQTQVSDYLEDQNASTGDNTFTPAPTTPGIPFNDRLVAFP